MRNAVITGPNMTLRVASLVLVHECGRRHVPRKAGAPPRPTRLTAAAAAALRPLRAAWDWVHATLIGNGGGGLVRVDGTHLALAPTPVFCGKCQLAASDVDGCPITHVEVTLSMGKCGDDNTCYGDHLDSFKFSGDFSGTYCLDLRGADYPMNGFEQISLDPNCFWATWGGGLTWQDWAPGGGTPCTGGTVGPSNAMRISAYRTAAGEWVVTAATWILNAGGDPDNDILQGAGGGCHEAVNGCVTSGWAFDSDNCRTDDPCDPEVNPGVWMEAASIRTVDAVTGKRLTC